MSLYKIYKDMADEVNFNSETSILNTILKDIEKEAKLGRYSLLINKYLPKFSTTKDKILEKLRSKEYGFEIESFNDQRDNITYITIKWN